MQSRVSCLMGVVIKVGAEVKEADGGAVKLKNNNYVLSKEAGCKPHEMS